MSNGICVVAQNNSTTNYVKQAYALALSILAKSPNTNISLITNDIVPSMYKDVFDKVIPIPWSDIAYNDWKIENRYKVYYVTPYINTIVFDVDMLVLDDISPIWSNLHNLSFTTNIKTYRNEPVTTRYYRRAFDANNLPEVYVGMCQFSKGNEAHNFFKLLDVIIQNWEVFYKKYAPKSMQTWNSVDLSAAIALKLLDSHTTTLNSNSMLSFTHMKPQAQHLAHIPSKWTDILSVDFGNDNIYINGYKQSGVLHYVEDEFLTSDMLTWLEERV
tara:strand:- start:647 stop:1465 length:819 start_codon:yes stop_codon:yes gene_type:complete